MILSYSSSTEPKDLDLGRPQCSGSVDLFYNVPHEWRLDRACSHLDVTPTKCPANFFFPLKTCLPSPGPFRKPGVLGLNFSHCNPACFWVGAVTLPGPAHTPCLAGSSPAPRSPGPRPQMPFLALAPPWGLSQWELFSGSHLVPGSCGSIPPRQDALPLGITGDYPSQLLPAGVLKLGRGRGRNIWLDLFLCVPVICIWFKLAIC